MAEKSNAEVVKENRAYIEQNRYEYPNCPHPAVDKLEDACDRLEQALAILADENKRRKEDLNTYGNHLPKCAYVQGLKGGSIEDCDCGFEQALKEP